MGELGFNPGDRPDLSKRTGYIEGREELFRSKIIILKGDKESSKGFDNILTVSRDPGSASTLVPVMKTLLEYDEINISVITDGRAEDMIKGNFNYEEIEIDSPLNADSVIPHPDLILADASEEQGLDTYANATFSETPMVLIEDYPGSSTRFLQATKERPGLHLPKKICVMDEMAKQSLLEKFPELIEAIEVTGQPAFDRITKEDIPQIEKETREKLGIKPEEKVIAFMSTDEVMSEQFEKICQQIGTAPDEFKLIFRRHPRDNTSYEQYFDILQRNGIDPIDSREVKTDEVSAAADIVFTTWSTAGLEAIYRGKLTVHIVDGEVLNLPPTLDMPLSAVSLNASVGANRVQDIPEIISQLLDSDSDLAKMILQNMKEYYPNDGNNSKRVIDVIKTVLGHSRINK